MKEQTVGTELYQHRGYGKTPRLNEIIYVTEKIDGTNGLIFVDEVNGVVLAGGRNRWLTEEDTNHGFWNFVEENKEDLLSLGTGAHYGEWYGKGINRGYELTEKKFVLFNHFRAEREYPKCCQTVPVLLVLTRFDTQSIDARVEGLRRYGSVLAPGYMKAEGAVVYHSGSKQRYKILIDKE